MLRTLNSRRDAGSYETVWTGASWRDVAPPEPPTLEDHSVLRRTPNRPRGRPSLDEMRAYLTLEPVQAKRAAADLGISQTAAAHLLWRLAQAGAARRVDLSQGRRRCVGYVRAGA